MKSYIIIYYSPDGGASKVESLTADELSTALNENWYGEDVLIASNAQEDWDSFSGIVIIEGKIVMPQAKEKVTQWELP